MAAPFPERFPLSKCPFRVWCCHFVFGVVSLVVCSRRYLHVRYKYLLHTYKGHLLFPKMDEYAYKLVVFPNDDSDLISIEIVPSCWVVWNKDKDILECYYMPGLLSNKKKAELRSMVKQGTLPDSKWPKYEVEIRGRAKSYEDAIVGMKRLKSKQYAYSTDDEVACQIKILQEKKLYQLKKPETDNQLLEDTLDNFQVSLISEEMNDDENRNKQCQASRSPVSHKEKRHNGRRKKSKTPSRSSTSNDSSKSDGDEVMVKLTKSSAKESNHSSGRRSNRVYSPVSNTSAESIEKQNLDQWIADSRSKRFPRRSAALNQPSSYNFPEGENSRSQSYCQSFLSSGSLENNRGDIEKSKLPHFSSSKGDRHVNKKNREFSATDAINSHFSDSSEYKSDHINVSHQLNKRNNSHEKISRSTNLSIVHEREELKQEDSLRDFIETSHRSLSKQIADLKGLVVSAIVKIKHLSSIIKDTPTRIHDSHAEDERPDLVPLPCSTMEDFEHFNDLLQVNPQHREKIKKIIWKSIDKERSMVRCLGDLIRKFVSVDVGNLLVPVKTTVGKKIFKDTSLYILIEDIYIRGFGEPNKLLTHKTFLKALQGVLHNTKYWSGTKNREIRARKNRDKIEDGDESQEDDGDKKEDETKASSEDND